MKLRLVPWLTDSSIKFLNNLFKWYPSIVDEKISVLEFGGGGIQHYIFFKKAVKY